MPVKFESRTSYRIFVVLLANSQPLFSFLFSRWKMKNPTYISAIFTGLNMSLGQSAEPKSPDENPVSAPCRVWGSKQQYSEPSMGITVSANSAAPHCNGPTNHDRFFIISTSAILFSLLTPLTNLVKGPVQSINTLTSVIFITMHRFENRFRNTDDTTYRGVPRPRPFLWRDPRAIFQGGMPIIPFRGVLRCEGEMKYGKREIRRKEKRKRGEKE